jgi:polyphosphate kinase
MMQSQHKTPSIFFHRDLSWLSFNERVLAEANRDTVPLMERIRFLAIYSSNLDEFYRVRIPALNALNTLSHEPEIGEIRTVIPRIKKTVVKQQKEFGRIIEKQILQAMVRENKKLYYKESIPDSAQELLQTYFMDTVAAYIQVAEISSKTEFFPQNNKIYLLVATRKGGKDKGLYVVNIPSDTISRFYSYQQGKVHHIFFLDDIVKLCLPRLFPGQKLKSSHSFKITRDAELNIEDEFGGNLARKIEKKIDQRDLGQATRFLYEPGIPTGVLTLLMMRLKLSGASFIRGGTYHNLKDFSGLPLMEAKFNYEPKAVIDSGIHGVDSLFERIKSKDFLIHLPYHSYNTVLRFFNEAAIDPAVTKIYVTLYRVADNSRIVNALISAAKNGKRVTVFVELKARFDEANNIKWSKKMKAAGVRIIESIPGLKVHAKIALVKRKTGNGTGYLGLLSTGNFNENTAKFYTDHILFTASLPMLREMETLFVFLKKRKRKAHQNKYQFNHLQVGFFNLQQRFMELIDREIQFARSGKPASIKIKFNNLEDHKMIEKLYEASSAGVEIVLIIRGICCLVPGVPGLSERIKITRIIDRYLEHGRIFIFGNGGFPEVYLGSADWMIRNLYRRIEVCFPIYDPNLRTELIDIVNIQLSDNCQAVIIDRSGRNIAVRDSGGGIPRRSQELIRERLALGQAPDNTQRK